MKTQLKNNLPACLWMQAGVVARKNCLHDFFCTTCKFDRALRKICKDNKEFKSQGVRLTSKKEKLVFWKDKLRAQQLSKRPCVHHMKGNIDFKICPKSYNCIDCEFDQYFHDQFKVYTMVNSIKYNDIDGVTIPAGYYLHHSHTWVKIEDNNHVRIGIDDFASRLFGTFDKIEAPLTGKKVVQTRPSIKAKRNRNTINFPSPVSGVVTEVNPAIRSDLKTINNKPYTNGWIMRVHCENLKNELKNLLFLKDTSLYIKDEIEHLYNILEDETGLMAADGGQLGHDIFGNAPKLKWSKLVKKFIKKDP